MTDPVAIRFARALEKASRLLGRTEAGAALGLADGFGIGGFVRRLTGEQSSRGEPSADELMRRLYNRMLLDAATEASHALSVLTVPHFFAKGVALLEQQYRLGDRELADIDLYVHPSSARLVVQTLKELGYRELSSDQQSGPATLRPGVVLSREGDSGLEAVTLDLHWGIEPVGRLLPRADTPIPEMMWDALTSRDALPVPTAGHHAALVVYHLVHHDLLHVRGLIDLALLWRDLGADEGSAVSDLAAALGVERALRALGQVLIRDLGLQSRTGIEPPPEGWRGRRLNRLLVLHRWLAWAAVTDERDLAEITRRRIMRRFFLLDEAWRVLPVLGDVLVPPRAHLRWRWPDADSDVAAWSRHLRGVMKKALTS